MWKSPANRLPEYLLRLRLLQRPHCPASPVLGDTFLVLIVGERVGPEGAWLRPITTGSSPTLGPGEGPLPFLKDFTHLLLYSVLVPLRS